MTRRFGCAKGRFRRRHDDQKRTTFSLVMVCRLSAARDRRGGGLRRALVSRVLSPRHARGVVARGVVARGETREFSGGYSRRSPVGVAALSTGECKDPATRGVHKW